MHKHIKHNEKMIHILKFLTCFHNHKIATLMESRGFTQETLEEGWDLFDKTTGRKSRIKENVKALLNKNKELLHKIDQWEHTWIDVANAALFRLYPEAHKLIFENFHEEKGPAIIANLRHFLSKIEEIRNKEDRYGEGAIDILEKRGLGEDVLEEGRNLLVNGETANFHEIPVQDEELKAERYESFETLWRWYKDWSHTAYTIVKSNELRREMGFQRMHANNIAPKNQNQDTMPPYYYTTFYR